MSNRVIKPNRRRFLQGMLAMSGAGMMPNLGAIAAPAERKFLFLFASGGWDVCQVFEPHYNAIGVDMDPDTQLGTVGNLRYVDGLLQPAIGSFFQRWGPYASIVNGIDSKSVGHGSSTQFMLTGTSADNTSDWPTIIAANSVNDYPLPHIVFSGPSFVGPAGATVVRGGNGTILDLIDGSIVGRSDQPAPVMGAPSDSMIDSYVYSRAQRHAELQTGDGRVRSEALLKSVARSMELEGRRFEAGLSTQGGGLFDRASMAVDAMRFGLCRCAMTSVGFGWDTHGNNDPQETNFNAVFTDLNLLMEKLATTPGLSSPYLIDEVVVVVMSEFGRTPRYNAMGGRDHWPYTSALVMGSGVNGNQTLGYTDDRMISQPVDYASGLSKASGDILSCENFGAGLLTLAGLDSSQYLPGVQPFTALVKGA